MGPTASSAVQKAMACLASIGTTGASATAAGAASLVDVAFLEGAWRGGVETPARTTTIEEIWSGPGGGVMTGMARGHTAAPDGVTLNALEYIVIAEEGDDLVMRFEHFRADYSTWEDNGPVVLRLDRVEDDDATFRADDPDAEIAAIRYFKPSDATLQADVTLFQEGQDTSFSQVFSRAE